MPHEDDWLLDGAVRDTQSALRDPRLPEPQQIAGVFYRAFPPVKTGYGVLNEMLRSEWLGDIAAVDQVFTTSSEPGTISAWHAHSEATDRLFVLAGSILAVLYDSRPGSPTLGVLQRFHLGGEAPGLLIVPPHVWHGVKNIGDTRAHMLNAVDVAYCYEAPDHWRLPQDSDAIPYRF